MNKKEFFKLGLLIPAICMSLIAFINSENFSILLVFLSLAIVSLTIFMIYKYKDIKNKKWAKPSIIALIVISLLIIGFICFNLFAYVYPIIYDYYGNKIKLIDHIGQISDYAKNLSIMIYFISLFLVLFFCFDNLDKKSNKTNYILTILATILVIGIHIYYFSNSYINSDLLTATDEKFNYMLQNYPYFSVMYIGIIIHQFINKEKQS